MNSDPEDPNNHVPPVTPDDDWADLDEPADASQTGVMPMRPERGLPPKKERRTLHVNHHAPKLKLQEDGNYSPLEPRPVPEKKEEPPLPEEEPAPKKSAGKATKKTATKAAKKAAKKSTAKSAEAGTESGEAPAKKTRSQGKRNKATVEEELPPAPPAIEPTPGIAVVEVEGEGEAERIALPTGQGAKRFRVHEIAGSREAVDKRVMKLSPKTEPDAQEKALKEAAKPRRRFVRGEHSDWGRQSGKGSFRWIFYTGVGVIALVVVAVVLSQLSNKGKDDGEQSYFSQVAPEELDKGIGTDAGDSKMMEMLTTGQEEAIRVFAAYAGSKTADEAIGLVYQADRNGALIAKDWKPLSVPEGWKPSQESVWSVLDEDGFHYGVLQGTLPDFSSFKAFFRYEGDVLKLDWKATTGYGSADFPEMQKGQGDCSEIRAMVSLADFHTFALPEGEFRSFRLGSPNGETNVWGYTKIGGVLDGKLVEQFTPSEISGEAQSEIAVVLSLQQGSKDALPNQWIITGLVRLNWLDE